MRRFKRYNVLAFRFTLLALSLIVLFFLVDLGVVVNCIVSIPLSMIAILVAVSLFQTWMASIRWRWVHPDESKQLSSWQYFRLMMVSNPQLLQFAQLVFSRLGNSGMQLLHLLETWKKALRFFRCNYASLLKALMLCLPIHGLSFLAAYLLSEILGMGISIFDISMSLSLAWVVTAIPITISGLGVRELSLIYLLSFYNVTAESATALSIYLHIIQVIMGLIGLVFLFTTKSSLQLSETNGGFSTENTD